MKKDFQDLFAPVIDGKVHGVVATICPQARTLFDHLFPSTEINRFYLLFGFLRLPVGSPVSANFSLAEWQAFQK